MDTTGGLPDALVAAIEGPGGSRRTVVVIVARDQAAIAGFVPAFLGTSQSSDISRSVSVLHGNSFSSYEMGGPVYWVGDISLLTRITILLQEFPWLIALVAVIFCFLIAVLLQAMLRRRARVRLQGVE